jgi:alkylresorcinol/alkylpyrone synthase
LPRLVAVTTASPEFRIGQEEAAAFAGALFRGRLDRLDTLLHVFANAGISQRYVAKPPGWYSEPHDLAQKNRDYIDVATELSARAARDLLERTGLGPHDVDHILYVNTTGLATPTIDARLINILGLRSDIRRTPLWGLGCAGGAAGLSHAFHLALGHPRARILVVACELCSLTFLADDFSKSNFVATALFADGAAAALVVGDEAEFEGGLKLLDTQSHFYPDSLSVMGWNVLSTGLQVVFDKRIPDIVAEHAAGELDGFLARHGLGRDDIAEFLYHPGGLKVLEAYQTAYGGNPQRLRHSRAVLRDFGNMSSVTVLFVIARYLAEAEAGRSGYGVISALGPGFSSESLLVAL